MRTLATYHSRAGARELVLVQIPDQPTSFTLLDVLAGRPGADADPRIVEHNLHTVAEAEALATDYVRRATVTGAPAVDYSPWDDDAESEPLAA